MYKRTINAVFIPLLLAICCFAPLKLFAQKVGCLKYAHINGIKDRNMKKYWLGYGLAGMDVNKDGFTDVIVSAVGPNTAFVYYGGLGIFDTTADLELRGGGEMVTGDFDGDGLEDLVVHRLLAKVEGADIWTYDSFYVYMGVRDSMYAIETSPRFVISCPIDTVFPRNDKGIIGDVLFAADLDGDKRDDLIIGGISYDIDIVGTERAGWGALFVWHYPRGEDPDTLSYIKLSDTYYRDIRSFGVGDVNGDGIADIQVALTEWLGPGQPQPPKVRVGFGRPGNHPDLSTPDQVFGNDIMGYTTDTYIERLSNYWTTMLDVNRDGLADLLWVPCRDSLWVMYGTGDGLSGTVDKIFVNPDTERWSGFHRKHHQIGDHNGDGNDDYILAMGADGWPAMVVFAGNSTGLTNQPISVCVAGGQHAGRYIVNLGDITGDGADDHINSDPRPPGEPFTEPGYCTVVESAWWVKTDVERQKDDYNGSIAPFDIDIYPSPTTGDINIMLHDEEPGEYQLRLYSLEGRTILTRNYELIRSNNVLIVQAQEIPAASTPAVYFIELTHAGNTARRKVMVQPHN